MIRLHWGLAALGLLAVSSAATAAALIVVKESTTISDPQGNLLPKAVPGALIDYTVSVTNPLGNALTTVTGIRSIDSVPARTQLRISDLGLAGSGPVEFADGSLLGTGLLGTNLSFTFKGLDDETDSVDFSSDNGANWTYHPIDQGGGYDGNVTTIRVRLSGNHAAGTKFRLRFRVQVR